MKALPARKPCPVCERTFEPQYSYQRYCSNKCKIIQNRKRDKAKAKQAMIDGSGPYTLKMRFLIFKRDGFTCQYCGRSAQKGAVLHIDHIVPKSKEGNFCRDNLITSCFECNMGKKDLLLSKRETKKLKERISANL